MTQSILTDTRMKTLGVSRGGGGIGHAVGNGHRGDVSHATSYLYSSLHMCKNMCAHTHTRLFIFYRSQDMKHLFCPVTLQTHRCQTSCMDLIWASLIAQLVKNLPAMQETPVGFLGGEDPLEKG